MDFAGGQFFEASFLFSFLDITINFDALVD